MFEFRVKIKIGKRREVDVLEKGESLISHFHPVGNKVTTE